MKCVSFKIFYIVLCERCVSRVLIPGFYCWKSSPDTVHHAYLQDTWAPRATVSELLKTVAALKDSLFSVLENHTAWWNSALNERLYLTLVIRIKCCRYSLDTFGGVLISNSYCALPECGLSCLLASHSAIARDCFCQHQIWFKPCLPWKWWLSRTKTQP